LENNFVSLFPTLGNQRLARKNSAREPHLDILEGSVLLINGLAGYAEEAQAVQDGHWKTAYFGKCWVDVEGTLDWLVSVRNM
jgi:hypothetical protein